MNFLRYLTITFLLVGCTTLVKEEKFCSKQVLDCSVSQYGGAPPPEPIVECTSYQYCVVNGVVKEEKTKFTGIAKYLNEGKSQVYETQTRHNLDCMNTCTNICLFEREKTILGKGDVKFLKCKNVCEKGFDPKRFKEEIETW